MQCLLDGTLAGNAVHAGKLGADDMNPVMSAALVAGVADVQMALIGQFEQAGRKGGFQTLTDGLRAHAGNTFLNGRMRISAYTPAST